MALKSKEQEIPTSSEVRWRMVADEFQRWLDKNPKALPKKRYLKFNQIADSFYRGQECSESV